MNDADLHVAMFEAGWSYDKATNGFRKDVRRDYVAVGNKGDVGHTLERLWVSAGQARDALAAAQKGEAHVPKTGLSETFAGILTGAGLGDDLPKNGGA